MTDLVCDIIELPQQCQSEPISKTVILDRNQDYLRTGDIGLLFYAATLQTLYGKS